MIWNRFPKYSYKVTDGNGVVSALCGMNKYIITTGDPLTAVPNGIYDSSSYLSLLI